MTTSPKPSQSGSAITRLRIAKKLAPSDRGAITLRKQFGTGLVCVRHRVDPKAKLRGFRPKVGEAYGRIEAPKGELGFYINSKGGGVPYRLKIRSPSFVNLSILPQILPGCMMSDVVAVLGSLDFVMGECDR